MFIDAVPQIEPESELIPDRPTVLIIDDDVDQADVLGYRLESQGFNTIISNTGKEGIQRAQHRRPNLVLLDLRLPDMSGFEVCQKLADDPNTCEIPVIIVSGMERPDIVRRARSAGSQYYVRKPYDPNVLLILIQNAIQEASNW